jgi:sugar phosphate permease
VLAAGTAAQASFSTITLGLPAITPALREAYDLNLQGVGFLLATEWVGLTVGLLPWGLVTDRIGERRALGIGLAACGACIAAAAAAGDAITAGVLIALAGATGSSVQSASGRAVMQWFAQAQRGLAFGIRQTAVPVGGLIGALVLPALAESHGIGAAFVFLGSLCFATSVVGVIVVRELPSEGVDPGSVGATLRDSRLWFLCGGSGLYVMTQIVLFSFVVLFLHDERGFSPTAAAGAFAVAHALAMALRIGAGRWSDRLRSRILPLRRIGVATFAALAATAVVLDAPDAVVVPLLVATTALSAAWNGLSFVAAAELAGTARSGAAIGFQQTALSLAAIFVPPAFAAGVAATSWRTGFAAAAVAPLVGWALLGRVRA